MPNTYSSRRKGTPWARWRQLALAGMSRRIAITIPSAALVADLLRATDLVATVGARAARRMARDGSIVAVPPPLPMPPWRMSMVWPGRNSADEGLAWLRERLKDAALAGDGTLDPISR